MQLSAMRQWLATHDIQLSKSLGQNFLHDANQLRRIIANAGLGPTDRVLEIGPGLGPLTELLLAAAGEVIAVEKDERLFDVLALRFPTEPKLTLIHADALVWLRDEPRDWTDWKLVANLPYSVASPILVELAEAPGAPRRMTITLQHEVVRRLAAEPDTDDYGLLSLLVQLRFSPGERFKIPADCFYPVPDVESSCITMNRRPEPLLDREQSRTYKRLVKLAFSQRRKKMMKLLKQNWSAELLGNAFAAAEIHPDERAEKVSLAQFVTLARLLHAAPPSGAAPQPTEPA